MSKKTKTKIPIDFIALDFDCPQVELGEDHDLLLFEAKGTSVLLEKKVSE